MINEKTIREGESEHLKICDFDEREQFWIIAGLIESRQINIAEKAINDFKPDNLRLLLALHLGCYHIEKLQVTKPSDKKIAKRLCNKIQPKIEHLMKDVMSEMKSQLLEIQSGEVKAIEEKPDIVSKGNLEDNEAD